MDNKVEYIDRVVKQGTDCLIVKTVAVYDISGFTSSKYIMVCTDYYYGSHIDENKAVEVYTETFDDEQEAIYNAASVMKSFAATKVC